MSPEDVQDPEVRSIRMKPRVESSPERKRIALLCGINHYVDQNITPLRFCVNDVRALQRRLRELSYTVVALHDDAEERLLPTRQNIEAELRRVCGSTRPGDLLLVHFACHGKLVDGQAVLLPRDVRLDTLAENALPIAKVQEIVKSAAASQKVVLLDACHGGVEVGRDVPDPGFYQNVYERAEGFVLLAASTSRQGAHEWGQKRHGVFTYFLLDGLSGAADRAHKGFVTVDDIKIHVLNGLRTWSVETGGRIQDPTVRNEGVGDIVLAELKPPPPWWSRFARLGGMVGACALVVGMVLWAVAGRHDCRPRPSPPPAQKSAQDMSLPGGDITLVRPPQDSGHTPKDMTPSVEGPARVAALDMGTRKPPLPPQLGTLVVLSDPGAIVRLGNRQEEAKMVDPGSRGVARFRVPVGTYQLSCFHRGFNPQHDARSVAVKAGGGQHEDCFP